MFNYTNAVVSSLAARRDVFLQVASLSFPVRVEVWGYTISQYIYSWLIDCFGCLYFVPSFGAGFFEVQRGLGDTTVRYIMFGYSIWFVKSLCDCTFLVLRIIVFQTERSFLWHQYVGIKIQSNHLSSIALPRLNCLTYNSSILLFFDSYHWPFDLDWLFEIRNDSGFFQNLLWGLRYFRCTDWGEIFFQYQGEVRSIGWTSIFFQRLMRY